MACSPRPIFRRHCAPRKTGSPHLDCCQIVPEQESVLGMVNYWSNFDSRYQFHQHSRRRFYVSKTQKRKKTLMTWLSFFVHLGSAHLKATRKKLMKLTPGFLEVLYWATICCCDSEKRSSSKPFRWMLLFNPIFYPFATIIW